MNEIPDPSPQTNPPRKPLPVGKVVLINFGIMLGYLILSSVFGPSGLGGDSAYGVLAVDAALIAIQAGLNFVLGLGMLLSDYKHVGGAMMIAAFVIAVLGFGACVGKVSILESI